ncbi:MAG TPA: iron-sulfur cluster assembly scaffold protein [Candidatus Tectomicrobia bacterium]
MTPQYSATIFEHFRHPRNYGALREPEVAYEAVNALCGDRIRIELNIGVEQTIVAVRFRGDSCIISRAAASILTELIQGRTLQEVTTFPQEVLLTTLHMTIRPARVKCALLPFHALQAGIAAYLS